MQYGTRHHEEHLGNADYALVAHGSADVFTFCMCAGGHIISECLGARLLLHERRMSLSKRDSPFANSGLVVLP